MTLKLRTPLCCHDIVFYGLKKNKIESQMRYERSKYRCGLRPLSSSNITYFSRLSGGGFLTEKDCWWSGILNAKINSIHICMNLTPWKMKPPSYCHSKNIFNSCLLELCFFLIAIRPHLDASGIAQQPNTLLTRLKLGKALQVPRLTFNSPFVYKGEFIIHS